MGININNTTLTSNAGLVVTDWNGNQFLKQNPLGTLQRYSPGQPMFRAGQSGTAASVSVGAAASQWYPLVLNYAGLNIASCYNISNGRFTAPLDGLYMVIGATYFTGPTTGFYMHPSFWVNGSEPLRRGNPIRRIRGHGRTAGYACDCESYEIIPLIAGDYVNLYLYNGNVICTHIPQYGRFEGYLFG